MVYTCGRDEELAGERQRSDGMLVDQGREATCQTQQTFIGTEKNYIYDNSLNLFLASFKVITLLFLSLQSE